MIREIVAAGNLFCLQLPGAPRVMLSPASSDSRDETAASRSERAKVNAVDTDYGFHGLDVGSLEQAELPEPFLMIGLPSAAVSTAQPRFRFRLTRPALDAKLLLTADSA